MGIMSSHADGALPESIELRAENILNAEPLVQKTPSILDSFKHGVNARPQLDSFKACYAAHGSNLSVVLSALRNCNGQLCGEKRRRELGVQATTGECLKQNQTMKADHKVNATTYSGYEFVCAVNARTHGLGNAINYAMIESGHGSHFWGKPDVERVSEASTIPVVMLGELVDPTGRGAEKNDEMYLNVSEKDFNRMHKWWAPHVKETFPTKEVYGQIMSFQLIGERLNIRALLVQDATDPSKDETVRALVKDILHKLSLEHGYIYDDIYVGLLRQKEGQARMSEADFERFMFSDGPDSYSAEAK